MSLGRQEAFELFCWDYHQNNIIFVLHMYIFLVGDMSVGRQEAFELFRRDYHQNDVIEDNKAALKQRYADAKTLGEQVNKARNKISKFSVISIRFLLDGQWCLFNINCSIIKKIHLLEMFHNIKFPCFLFYAIDQ